MENLEGKLEGKYTIDQVHCLRFFMNNEEGFNFRIYKDKPTIFIGKREDIGSLSPYLGSINDVYFDVFVRNVDSYTKKLTQVFGFMYETMPLEEYNKMVIEPKGQMKIEDRLPGKIYAVFENNDGIEFELFSASPSYEKLKMINKTI